MRALSLLGWALLIGALLSAVGEIIARASHGPQGLYFSAQELWLALAPDSYERVRSAVAQALSPSAWSALAASVLKLPAWLLLGAPGGLIAWASRPKPESDDDFDPDAPFLLDELARRAREEGYGDGDDRLPEDQGTVILNSAREAGQEPPLPPPIARDEDARAAAGTAADAERPSAPKPPQG